MILAVALLAATLAPDVTLAEAERALMAGRPEQAREMIRAAVGEGASGDRVDRLLADLAFAEGRWVEAREAYALLLARAPDDAKLLERGGLSALQSDEPDRAIAWLDKAVARPQASWRAWNARGVAADRERDWATADRAYAAGLTAAPGNATLHNNLGWSLMLRGRWAEASDALARAAALEPSNRRIAANAELARTAILADLPERRAGEGDRDFAARLNDAGVIALRQGDRARAVAAFARALQTSDRWYARAANNLALAGGSVAP